MQRYIFDPKTKRKKVLNSTPTLPFFQAVCWAFPGSSPSSPNYQNVKRRHPQRHFLHQRTSWNAKKAFWSDSQNTTWYGYGCFRCTEARLSAKQQHSHNEHGRDRCFLLPSELLTAHSFQRIKLGTFYFHLPKIWLPGMKQSCLEDETILFDAANYIVWLAKQYSSGHVLSIFRKRSV